MMDDETFTIPPARGPVMTSDGEPVACPNCGGIFERPFTVVVEGKAVQFGGHVIGDPRVCLKRSPEILRGEKRDARARRDGRRGR